MLNQEQITALVSLLGTRGALIDEKDKLVYETGARHDRGHAAIVLRPATVEDLSAAVSFCVGNGIALVPQSGNTGVVAGSTPDGSGDQAVLSLDRMTGTFELDLDNRSVRLGAGIRLSDLNQRLESHGLFFPVELGADPLIGGMVSTNTGGARFLKYGDVRRNVLGLKVVLADAEGTVLDLQTDLRKNNTGVDWKQIFIGTSGAFGIVAECTLNLEPLPRQTATALLVPTGSADVMPLLRAMEERLGAYLSAFEGMSGNAIRATFEHVPSLRNPFQTGAVPDYVLLAEVTRNWLPREGEQSLDAVLETALAEIWEMDGAPLADALVGPPHEIWALRHAISEGVKHKGKLIAFDLAFRRGDIMRFCEQMKHDIPARYPGISVCDFGHVGDGGVHFNLVVDPVSPLLADPEFEPALRQWVYSIAVEAFHGSFSGEHAIGRRNQSFYDRYTDDKRKALAAGLKALTSPGKLGSVSFG